MYSVLRFRELPDDEAVARVGRLLNETIPGLCDGPDRVVGRISVSLADDEDWVAHTAELQDRLQRLASVVDAAQAAGANLEVDIAIWREEHAHWLTEYTFAASLMRRLAAQQIGLRISFYDASRLKA